MARAENTELTDAFEEFFRNYYRNEIGELAQKYPNDRKSLWIDWQDLYRFDQDLADDFRSQPEQLREYAEEALRLYDLPVDVKLGQAHVRVSNLPETTDIREIRHEHRGRLIAVQGIVRKATDVRPKVTTAAFECQRCGTLTRIPQVAGDFQEPHECQGCERQGPFRLNMDQSEFVDAQKIRVQESPEGLRGGETPQNIDVNIEDDITGEVTAGDHVCVTGVLKLDQRGSDQEQSPMFDVYMDGVDVEIEDEQFEEMEITDEDKKEIVELSSEPELYEQMIGALAPSIYGYDEEKLAMILQLFSGVTKHLPDGSRIRGDLHMLLIGDPGTGKCLSGDTRVTLADGSDVPIRDLVEENLEDPKPVDDGVWDTVDVEVPSLQDDGTIAPRQATKVWKREAPDDLYRIRTATGRELDVTPSHPLFVQRDCGFEAVRADELEVGESVATRPERTETASSSLVVADGGTTAASTDRIDSIERIEPDDEWVYDLEVEGTHNYVSNGVVSHNSQMLSYIKNIAPRSVYTSGKGSSSAGLCVTGDTLVHTTEGFRKIRTLVERELPEPVDAETSARRAVDVTTFDRTAGEMRDATSSHVWRMPEKPCRRVETNHGKELEASVNTPVLTCGADGIEWTEISDVEPGDYVAVPKYEDADLGSPTSPAREAVDADLNWDEVVAVEDTGEKEVFDLTVPETHNFVGNGVVTHNTAAAVRDDFGDGQQWTLEAGALVLADQGIAAVDELDKMRCVTGDTLVHLEDRVTRIRDLAHTAASDGTVEELENGRTVRDFDVTAWTMTETGGLERRPVTAIHEYEAPAELTRVQLESGESLEATHDHPFFVIEGGQRAERSASELEEGDWVYVPRDLRTAATDGGVATTRAKTEVERKGGVDHSFAKLLGYLAGDGNLYYDRDEGVYGVRFINAEEELLGDFEYACRETFDAEPVRPPSEQRSDGVETVRLTGKEYADAVIEAGMNLETYDGKTLPDAVTASSPAAKAAFVRALADAEGSVEDRNVKIHSASYELLLGTKHLLLEFGVSTQIQHVERSDGRDLYILAITDAASLVRFDEHVGFTLTRKQAALDSVVETVSGDRTILDVIPECGAVLESCRESLRLYQSECGIDDATYCNFENEDANVSIRLARSILQAFEDRKHEAADCRGTLRTADWERLERIKDRFHVSQAEIASGTSYTQQQISRLWGADTGLQNVVRDRLEEIVDAVAQTDLAEFRELVHADVKWRRIESIERTTPAVSDDRIGVLEAELANLLGCARSESTDRARELLATDPNPRNWAELRLTIERFGVSMMSIANDIGVDQSTVSRWFRRTVETDRFPEVKRSALERVETIVGRLREILGEIDERQRPKVYDLTVEGTHNFVANGMVVHNSEDRSAMHQALEQQSISVSKAGINATLKSRCSLLGAANPKYGRFDQFEPIGEQIDLEPALISRFDLIFTVTDQPDEEKDANLAEHIIQTNYAGELNTHREQTSTSNYSEEEVASVTDEVAPTIDPELLRKYIAYAKRNCYPTMTESAKAAIQQFYVDLRAKGQDEDAPVPVTARKLEALVRLAEASARVRLSDTVEESDANRVIEVVRSCLEDIGVDPETGEFDADVVETGTSKSQRDRIQNIKQIVADIEDEYDEGAPVDVVIERAEEVGIEESKAEHEIEKLKTKGEVYEPRNDHLRTT